MSNLYDSLGVLLSPKTVFGNVLDDHGVGLPSYLAAPFMKGINHRGYCVDAPENTLPAYVLSYLNGFKYVETDISFTSDDVPVLLHDDTIDRTSDGTGSISSLTYDQVSEYDFGSWFNAAYAGTKIPRLSEFLILCRNLGLHPYLELKNTASFTVERIQMVVDMVERYGMKGKVTYISYSDTYLSRVAAYDNKARLGLLANSNTVSTAIEKAVALRTGYNEVFLDSNSYTSTVRDACAAEHLPLEVWTIDNETTIAGLSDYITGVTSNDKNAGFIKLSKTLADNPLPA